MKTFLECICDVCLTMIRKISRCNQSKDYQCNLFWALVELHSKLAKIYSAWFTANCNLYMRVSCVEPPKKNLNAKMRAS